MSEFGFEVEETPVEVVEDEVPDIPKEAKSKLGEIYQRLKASKKLGLESVPCLYADDLNEDQIRALRIADNKVGEIATWDLEKLDIELDLTRKT